MYTYTQRSLIALLISSAWISIHNHELARDRVSKNNAVRSQKIDSEKQIAQLFSGDIYKTRLDGFSVTMQNTALIDS